MMVDELEAGAVEEGSTMPKYFQSDDESGVGAGQFFSVETDEEACARARADVAETLLDNLSSSESEPGSEDEWHFTLFRLDETADPADYMDQDELELGPFPQMFDDEVVIFKNRDNSGLIEVYKKIAEQTVCVEVPYPEEAEGVAEENGEKAGRSYALGEWDAGGTRRFNIAFLVYRQENDDTDINVIISDLSEGKTRYFDYDRTSSTAYIDRDYRRGFCNGMREALDEKDAHIWLTRFPGFHSCPCAPCPYCTAHEEDMVEHHVHLRREEMGEMFG